MIALVRIHYFDRPLEYVWVKGDRDSALEWARDQRRVMMATVLRVEPA